MKKLIIITLVIAMASVALAVTTITYNIPDDYGTKLLAALIAQSGAEVEIEIRRHASDPEDEYNARVRFDTPAHDPNVPNATFVKRRIALFAAALRVAHENKLRDDSLRTYHNNAPVIDVNTPDPNSMN
jgi:hypothetical protein